MFQLGILLINNDSYNSLIIINNFFGAIKSLIQLHSRSCLLLNVMAEFEVSPGDLALLFDVSIIIS